MTEHFSKDVVAHLANLARINLREDEVERLTKDLNVINDAIEKVSEVANSEVEATSHPIEIATVLREDIPATTHVSVADLAPGSVSVETGFVGDLLTVEQALSGAPKSEDNMFLAPSILGED